MNMTKLVFLLLVLLPVELAAQELRMGVRRDAVSMSYEVTEAKRGGANTASGPLAEAGFDGFAVHICDRVLVDMQRIYGASLKIEVKPVIAAEIWGMMDEGELDIICGPTTATQDRLQGRIASPPFFVSGVSYASRAPQEVQACVPIAGFLRSSTAGSTALRSILQSGDWPAQDVGILNEFLSGGASWKKLYKDCDHSVEPKQAFDTHDALADAFCAGLLKYYVGDFEIMARSLQAAKNRLEGPCDYALSDRTFSEERYVILGRVRDGLDDEPNSLVAHFFEILSRKLFFQPSVIDSAFDSSFPFAQPSRKLDFLFWALRGNQIQRDQ